MGTDAGVKFEATAKTVERMRKNIDSLNDVVNNSGLGVSCVPDITEHDGCYYLSGQTHWSYDGTNGKVFVEEAKAWVKKHRFRIRVISEWCA